MSFCQNLSSSGHDLMALHCHKSLFSFSEKERADAFKEFVGEAIIPGKFVCSFAGLDDSLLNVPGSMGSDELDGLSFAHREFDVDSVLHTSRGSMLGLVYRDEDTTLTVDDTGHVSIDSFGAHKVWETFIDYPSGEYAQVGGSSGQPILSWVEDIVISASKDAVALDGQRRINAPVRKHKAYTNDDYLGIAWPTSLRRLKNDLEGIHQYTVPGIQLIFNAEIGRYENVRYVEQTNIPKGISTDGITGTAWASGQDWIFFMGEDTVAEGVAVPEEMRAKIPTDYGRSKGVAWYYLGGFGIVQTQATEARIVMWDSAA